MTIYLDRLKKCYEENNEVGVSRLTKHFEGKWQNTISEVTLNKITFEEQEYKGYQLVIVGWNWSIKEPLDKHGNQFFDTPNKTQISRYGEYRIAKLFRAFGYDLSDIERKKVVNLSWASQFAIIAGTFTSNSASKTEKSAKKRIDFLAKLKNQRERLIEISECRLSAYGNADNPYNVIQDDVVYIQAHGRLRKGVVVGATGSRFIVGYVTPSNHNQLKWKTLPLSQLWIDSMENNSSLLTKGTQL